MLVKSCHGTGNTFAMHKERSSCVVQRCVRCSGWGVGEDKLILILFFSRTVSSFSECASKKNDGHFAREGESPDDPILSAALDSKFHAVFDPCLLINTSRY